VKQQEEPLRRRAFAEGAAEREETAGHEQLEQQKGAILSRAVLPFSCSLPQYICAFRHRHPTRPPVRRTAMQDAPIAWLNGRFLPLRDASLSVLDAGVTTGASVTERLRTFRNRPFLLDEHLARLKT
jgi:hypothetical protein